MRLHRFIGPFSFERDFVMVTDKDVLHQWLRVLRFEVGDQLILCDGQNHEIEGELIDLTAHLANVKILSRTKIATESVLDITVYFSLLKRENVELILEKATEIGVNKFVPIRTARTIKQDIKLPRLQLILKEASEQSGRGYVPEIIEAMTFEEVLAHSSETKNILFQMSAPALRPKDISSNDKKIALFIGPEGGWTESEIELAAQNNILLRSIGKHILRAETAVLIASALVLNYSEMN